MRPDSWASGESYEQYVGRWSRLVAEEFIRWLGLPPGKRWLDLGCGTGALSRAIIALASPEAVHGIDPSPSHIAFARKAVPDTRAAFSTGTAESTRCPAGSFDCVVSGLVLNFVPDPVSAVAEMKRVARSDGIVAAYVWDYAGTMEFMRYFWDAAAALDDAALALDEGKRFPLCRPDRLKALFSTAGVRGVEVRSIDVPTRFENFDDYWSPFLGGQGPAPGYAMSLDEERRNRLRNRLRSTLPIAGDGSINLTARAWAVKGRSYS